MSRNRRHFDPFDSAPFDFAQDLRQGKPIPTPFPFAPGQSMLDNTISSALGRQAGITHCDQAHYTAAANLM